MTPDGPSHTLARRVPILAILATSLFLNFWCITWGQPGGVEWDYDSIAGLQSVKESLYFPSQWRHKYPPVQFLINGAAYRPFLIHWFGSAKAAPMAEGRILQDPVLGRRFGSLIVLSHVISALMGTGSVLAVWLAARALIDDPLASHLAAAALAVSQMLVFYSHLGNLDVPVTFWLAWSVWAAVRLVRSQTLLNFALLGVLSAVAVCTKDSAAGFLAGLAAALVLLLVPQASARGQAASSWPLSPFVFRAFAGMALFALVFCFFNGVFHDPHLLVARLGHWVDGPGISDYNKGLESQWLLARRTLRDLCICLGWPLAIVALLSTIHALVRAPRVALLATLPLIAFYLLFVAPAHLIAPRFLLPGLPTLSIAIGAGCAAWMRWVRLVPWLRAAGLGLVFGLSLLYCLALDLELSTDTRYRAEQWFLEHVPAGSRVGILAPANLAPRLRLLGYQEDYRTASPVTAAVLEKEPPYPPYLLLSEKYFTAPNLFDQRFFGRLVAGAEGYRVVATFQNRYLYPKKTLLGLAGWWLPRLNQISPLIYVLQRDDGTQGGS